MHKPEKKETLHMTLRWYVEAWALLLKKDTFHQHLCAVLSVSGNGNKEKGSGRPNDLTRCVPAGAWIMCIVTAQEQVPEAGICYPVPGPETGVGAGVGEVWWGGETFAQAWDVLGRTKSKLRKQGSVLRSYQNSPLVEIICTWKAELSFLTVRGVFKRANNGI